MLLSHDLGSMNSRWAQHVLTGQERTVIIAVDLMAENGPRAVADGIKTAIRKGFVEPEQIVAIGTPEALERAMGKRFPPIQWRTCTEAIQMGEEFTLQARKRNSSMNVGINGMECGEFSAFVSPGETKFMVGLGITVLGRLKKGLKPAIALPMPNVHGPCLLIDAGASPDANANDLLHFAEMGSIYTRTRDLDHPSIGLLNMGEEPAKGNDTLQLAHRLLRESSLNFIGNVEGNDLFTRNVNVIVCPGLLGNIALKAAEGAIDALARKFGPVWKVTQFLYRKINRQETGGAILLGVKGTPIIAHGNSKRKDIANAIRTAVEEVKADVNSVIAAEVAAEESEEVF
jgi:glycerol-3-phosphate acyltransferase PlsX